MAGDGVAGEGEGDLTRLLETVELEPGKNGAGVCTNERVAPGSVTVRPETAIEGSEASTNEREALDVGTGSVSVTVFSESVEGSAM